MYIENLSIHTYVCASETGNTGNIVCSQAHKLGTHWEQDWEHREHSGTGSPIAPFQGHALAIAIALPAECTEAASDPVFVSLRPLGLWLIETTRQDFRNR